jgi:hypothetical protein
MLSKGKLCGQRSKAVKSLELIDFGLIEVVAACLCLLDLLLALLLHILALLHRSTLPCTARSFTFYSFSALKRRAL